MAEAMSYKGPYWRSNGALFIVVYALESLVRVLNRLLKETQRVDPLFEAHLEKYGDDETDEAIEDFAAIMQRTMDLEVEVNWLASTAILMSAIGLESEVNQFCYFNIGEITTEAIERLPIEDKLEVAHKVLGQPQFKGTDLYARAKRLTDWRNVYAHGKCTDRPRGPLRKNHLISPDEYPSAGDHVREVLDLVQCYILLSKHLEDTSVHEYTAAGSGFNLDAQELLGKISEFRFNSDGLLIGKRTTKRKVTASESVAS